MEDERKVRRWLTMKLDRLDISQLSISEAPFISIPYNLCGITLSETGVREGGISQKQDELKHLQDPEQHRNAMFMENLLMRTDTQTETRPEDPESTITLEIYSNTKALTFWSPKFNEIREWAEELGKVKTLKAKNVNLAGLPSIKQDMTKYYESNVIGASFAAHPILPKDKSGLLTKCFTFSEKKKWFVLRTGILSIYPKKTMAGFDQPIAIINVKNVDISFVGGPASVLEGREVDDLKFQIKCQ